MNLLTSLWRWLTRTPRMPTIDLLPVENWAERKANYERARRQHHGQAAAYAHLRKATHEALRREVYR